MQNEYAGSYDSNSKGTTDTHCYFLAIQLNVNMMSIMFLFKIFTFLLHLTTPQEFHIYV